MDPTVAIVIPNRNDSAYLVECLDSILAQSVMPDQVIVVDDQSTDGSVAIMRSKLAGVPGATILKNPTRLGTMGALNAGLDRARSDYVLFLSSNDYVEKGLVQRAKAGIARAGAPGVWSAMVWEVGAQGQGKRLYPSPVIAFDDACLTPHQCIRLAGSIGHWFTGTTLMYHRESLLDIGRFDSAFLGLGDMLAALTIASRKGAAFAPAPLAVMRQHEGGLMWRTLTDLPQLDTILARMESTGAALSPSLFDRRFCDLMSRRIRFTAIRALRSDRWMDHCSRWQGLRYRLLGRIAPLLRGHRRLQLAAAFLLLRPLRDALAIVWYRYLGASWVISRQPK